MHLKPKPLKKGWFLRSIKNALKLLARAPAEWVLIGIIAPLLMVYLDFFFLKSLTWSFIIIAGTILCFKSDQLQNQSFKDILVHIFKHPRLITMDVAAAAMIFFLIDYVLMDLSSLINEHYFASGLALLMLEVSYCFVLIPYALIKLLHRNFPELKNTHSTNEYLSKSGIPTFFTLHVMIGMKLNWSEACALSMAGYWAMNKNRHAVYLMLSFVFIFPAISMILLPWLYAVYREIFWQSGLKDLEANKKSSAALETNQAHI